jgi:hypothetical protein
MQLLQTHDSLEAAFRNCRDRRTPLFRNDFLALLKTLNVQCEGADRIFGFLDIRCTGVTTISEIVAALQCLQSGRNKMLSPMERNAKVKSNVGQIFQPALRLASEFKASVKEWESTENESASLASFLEDERIGSQTHSKEACGRKNHRRKVTLSKQPPQATLEVTRSVFERKTFVNITSLLQVLPPEDEEKSVNEFMDYFSSNDKTLKAQSPFVNQNYHLSEERPAKIVEKLKRGEATENA